MAKINVRKAIVFDLDGTLTRLQMVPLLTERLIAEGIFSPAAREFYQQSETDWKNYTTGFGDFITDSVLGFMGHLKEVLQSDVVRIAKEIIYSDAIHYYRYTLFLLRRAQELGYFTILLSHSPDFLIRLFGGKLGFTYARGTKYEVGENGKFTGECEKNGGGYNKGEELLQIFHQISEVSDVVIDYNQLEKLIVVGDSAGDISMMKLATLAICYRPSEQLFRFYQATDGPPRIKVVEYKTVVEVDGTPVFNFDKHYNKILL